MSITTAQAVKIFKALSDENRLNIVLSLASGEKSGTDLLKMMPFSQPTLSHHVAILCESEIVTSKRDGKTVLYRINTDVASEVSSILSDLSLATSEPVQKSEPVKVVKRAPAPKKVAPSKPAPVVSEPEPEPAPAPKRRRDDFDFFD